MAQALTFSEIVDRSFTLTKRLLKTYVLGALALIALSMAMRGIGGGLFALADVPMIHDNIVLMLTVGCIGLAFAIAGVLLQVLQTMYTCVIAVDRKKDVKAGVRKAWKYLWRLILGGIWTTIRSFVWIGILGIPFLAAGVSGRNTGLVLIGILLFIAGATCGVWFLPRLSFVNIIQLKEGSSVRASAEASMKRTKGYWGKIVGNNLLMSLSVGLVTLAIVALGAMLGFALIGFFYATNMTLALIIAIPLGLIVAIAFVLYLFAISLFARIFQVELYETIKANPKA